MFHFGHTHSRIKTQNISKVYFPKVSCEVSFCEVYMAYASSKLCEFILFGNSLLQYFQNFMIISMWVTRPERPKGLQLEVIYINLLLRSKYVSDG